LRHQITGYRKKDKENTLMSAYYISGLAITSFKLHSNGSRLALYKGPERLSNSPESPQVMAIRARIE
jgi:hypothetical protein